MVKGNLDFQEVNNKYGIKEIRKKDGKSFPTGITLPQPPLLTSRDTKKKGHN